MLLLILESIGTSELILIAVVALIVFGPRKLPQMAKMLGKTMAEFRNATNEFKTTWEREAAFESEDRRENSLLTDTVVKETAANPNVSAVSAAPELPEPKVRELSAEEADQIFEAGKKTSETTQTQLETQIAASKKDWL